MARVAKLSVVPVVLMALLGPMSGVSAAGLWSPVDTLDSLGPPQEADVAIDATGTAVAAWNMNGVARVAVRPPDGRFATPESLSVGVTGGPTVALDDRGGVVVIWSRGNTVAGAVRPPGGVFTLLPDLASGAHPDAPDVGFLASGEAIAVWGGLDDQIHAAVRPPGGAFASVGTLSTGVGNREPRLATAGARALVAWTATQNDGPNTTTRIRAAVRPPGGPFAAQEDLRTGTMTPAPGGGSPFTRGTRLSSPRPAISAAGVAELMAETAESQGVPGDNSSSLFAVVRPVGGGWTSPQPLEFSDLHMAGGMLVGDLVAGRGGEALHVAGQRAPSSPMVFFARGRPAGSTAYGPQVTLTSGDSGEVRGAALAQGRFLALVRSGNTLHSVAGRPDPGFERPLRLTTPSVLRVLGLQGTSRGEAAALWTTGADVQAAIYDDNAGPRGVLQRARDRVAPVLSRLSLRPRRFAPAGRGQTVRFRTARSTVIRWRLSEAARVTLRVERVRPGFRRGSRCVASRSSTLRARRCDRFVRVGSIVRSGSLGANAVRWRGRIRGRALARGAYRITAVARDAARNSSRARRARLRLLSR